MKTMKWLVCNLVAASVAVLAIGIEVCWAEGPYPVNLKCIKGGVASKTEPGKPKARMVLTTIKQVEDGVCSASSTQCNGSSMSVNAVCGTIDKTKLTKKILNTFPDMLKEKEIKCGVNMPLTIFVSASKEVESGECEYNGILDVISDDDVDAERQIKLAKLEALKQQYAAREEEQARLEEDSARLRAEVAVHNENIARLDQEIQDDLPGTAQEMADRLNALSMEFNVPAVFTPQQLAPSIQRHQMELAATLRQQALQPVRPPVPAARPAQQVNFVLPNAMPAQRPSANSMFFFGGSK